MPARLFAMSSAAPPKPNLLSIREELRAEALRAGFARAGFTTADPLGPAIQRRWNRWLARDVAGRMDYLRRTHPRRTHPRDLLPEAQSILIVIAAYESGPHPPPPIDQGT